MTIPIKLFKYISKQYVKSVMNDGKLLFRNLTYFRQYEDNTRGDKAEGIHIDHPDNPVTLTSLDGSITASGDFSFLNSINQDKVFVFCMSLIYKQELFDEFNADCCIVIENVAEFLDRCQKSIMRSPVLNRAGFLHREVDYYGQNNVVQRSIKEPENLPFFKDIQFQEQYEYRLVCGKKGALTRITRIVDNTIFDFHEEIKNGRPLQRIVKVGNLEQIARVLNKKQEL